MSKSSPFLEVFAGWLDEQFGLLSGVDVVRIGATCGALRSRFEPWLSREQAPLATNLQASIRALETLVSGVSPTWEETWGRLHSLESTLNTEVRYVYGPDWEVKPGKLVSKKGTWLKKNSKFSWELEGLEKLYLPQGIAMPTLQIGKVMDAQELKRHDWVSQHLRVWVKPSLLTKLEARQNIWYVYWPHFEQQGKTIVPAVDTWLKRTAQLSGELQPFELIYLPEGLPVMLSGEPVAVDEEWEKNRHPHVHKHRKIFLSSPPLTVKQEQFVIFVGQGDGPPSG